MLPDSGHLLPEELTNLGKRSEHVAVALRGRLGRQAQLCGQLGIRRTNVFIAALARKPAIESTTNGASLFDGRAGDERPPQVVHVGNFKRVRRVVIPQRLKESLVTD